MWVIKGVHDNVGNLVYTTIIHVVGEIVQMEDPVEPIAADAELGVTDIGETHGSKSPRLEAIKGTTSSLIKVGITIEKPSIRFDRDEFMVSIYAEVELAIGNEIRK